MASLGTMKVTIEAESVQLVERLRSLATFARELSEDFPYREDAMQAVANIEWIMRHVEVKSIPSQPHQPPQHGHET